MNETPAALVSLVQRAAIVWGAFIAPTLLIAQGTHTDAPAAYRRVMVPDGRPELWPTNGEKFVPVEKAQLAKLLAEARDQPAGGVVSRVDLYARLVGDEVRGTGRATIALPEGRASFVPWPSERMTIASPRWVDDARTPALVGSWGDGDGAPQGLLADREGDVRFEFRAQITPGAHAQRELVLATPPAPQQTLTLDLPESLTPSVAGGVAAPASGGAEAEVAPSDVPPGARRWVLRAPPTRKWRVSLVDARGAPAAPVDGVTAGQDVTHVISETGVETRCVLELTGERSPPATLTVVHSSRAHVVGASQDGARVAWTAALDAQGQGTATVRLNDDAGATRTRVTLRFWSPLELDEPLELTLPQVEGAHWLEARVRATIVAPLALGDAPRAEGAAPLGPVDDGPMTLGYQAFRPDATVTLSLHAPSPRPTVTVVRECDLMANQAQSSVTLEFPGARAPLVRTQEFLVPAGWRIESVESTPGDALEHMRVERRGSQRVLSVQLAARRTRATDAPPLSVRVAARRAPLRGAEGVALRSLVGVTPRGVVVTRDEMLVRAARPYQVRLRNVPRELLAGEDAPDWQSVRLRLDALAPGALGDAAARLVREPAEYVAACRVAVERAEAVWRYVAELDVTSSGGIPSRLEVAFDPPLPETAIVRAGADTDTPATALRLEAPDPDAGDVLVLPAGVSGHARYTVRLEAPVESPFSPPLPSVLGARRQTGALAVRGVEGGAVELHQAGLSPAPAAAPSGARAPATRFTFDPTEVGGGRVRAELTRRRSAGAAPTLALERLETRLLPSGGARRCAQYRTLAAHPTDAWFELPRGAELVSVRDQVGRPLAAAPSGDIGRRVVVTVAPETERVRVTYAQPGDDWRATRLIAPALPACDAAVSAWNWRVLLPDEFAPRGALLDAEMTERTWQSRLFGPLASPRGAAPPNPLAAESWRRFAGRLARLVGLLPAAPAHDSHGDAPPAGWASYDIPVVGDRGVSLPLVNRSTNSGTAAACGLLVMVLAAWAGRRALVYTICAAAVLAVAALTLPAEASVWATHLWLGVLMAAPLRLVADAIGRWPRTPYRAATRALAPSMAGLVIVWLGVAAVAQPTARVARAGGELESVLVPVDSDGAPVGDKSYVRAGFLERLLRSEQQRGRAAPADWAARSWDLSGALVSEAPAESVDPDRWTFNLEIATLRRNTTVRLPLRRADAAWADKALVDGVAAPLTWAAEGQACEFVVPEPGQRRVSIEFTPRATLSDGESCIQVRMPRVPHATLKLRVPPSLIDVRVPYAAQAVRRSADGVRVEADLSGGADALVCWTEPTPSTEPVDMSCDVLQWAHVTAEGAETHVRAIIEGTPPLPRRLRLEAPWPVDPAGGSAGDYLDVAPDGVWTEGAARLTYTTRVPLARRSGLGHVRVPPVRTINAAVRTRLVAVTGDLNLDVAAQSAGVAEPLDPQEFLSRWGASGDTPLAAPSRAAALADVQAAWEVRVAPLGVEPSITQEQLRLFVGGEQVHCLLTSTAVAGRWPVTSHVVHTPEDFRVERVGATSGDQARRAAWARPSPSRLVVFTRQAAGEVVALEVEGSVPWPANQQRPRPAPLLSMAPPGEQSVRVELRRASGVLVEAQVARPPLLAPTPPPEGPGAYVATATVTPADPPPALLVRPNEPRFDASAVSYHVRTREGFQRGCVARLSALEGALERLSLRVPPDAPGEPRIVAPGGAGLARRVDEGPGRWELTLPAPLARGEELEVALEFEGGAPSGNQLSAELARFPGARRRDALVAVGGADGSPVGRWRTRALGAAPDGARAQWSRFGGPEWRVHRAGRPGRGSVAWVVSDDDPPAPRLALQEVRALVDGEGRRIMLTRFWIEPQGAEECRVEAPEGQRLVALDVNGQPPITDQRNAREWRVLLPSASLGQAVSVVTVAAPADEGGLWRSPRLESAGGAPLETDACLWEVASAGASSVRPPEGSHEIGAAQRSRLRLRQVTRVAPPALRQAPAQEAESPFLAWWRSRMADALEASRASGAGGAGSVDPAEAFAADASRLAQGAYMEDRSRALLGTAPDVRWRRVQAPHGGGVAHVSGGAPRDAWRRLGLAVLVGGALGALAVAAARGAWPRAGVRYRNSATAALGLLWWLYFPLGLLGLALLLLAAAAELRERLWRTELAAPGLMSG